MMQYIDRMVSETELHILFNDNKERSNFISSYEYFWQDGNDNFYKKFIEDSINASMSVLQEDAVELSITLGYYKTGFFSEVRKILFFHKSEFLKLVCLDWLFEFYENIIGQDFLEVNRYVLKKAENKLLKVQSILNLLLVEKDDDLIQVLISLFKETADAAFFYRFVNGMDNSNLAEKITNQELREIRKVLNLNQNIAESQKDEISKKLQSL